MRTGSLFIRHATRPVRSCESGGRGQNRATDEQDDAVVGFVQLSFGSKVQNFRKEKAVG